MGETRLAVADAAGKARGNPPRRADLSFCHAVESDLEAFTYTITLGRWQHQHDLKPRENRVLRFFAALNRTGTAGFRGTRCSLGALAAAIRRCTEEAGSESTVKRALKELVKKGYLLKSHAWGKPRRFDSGIWRREQICVYTLTEKATRIWSDTCLPRSKWPGDELKKPEPLNGAQSFFQHPSSSDRPVKLEANVQEKVEPVASAPGDCSTAPPARNEEGNPLDPPPRSAPRPPARPVLRNVKPFTRKKAAEAVLKLLGSLLKHKGRPGKVAMARADFELAGGRGAGEEGSGVRWDYWLARWGSFTRAERRHHARTEILPLLLRDPPPSSAPPPRPAPPPLLEPVPHSGSVPRCDQAPLPVSRASPPSFEPDPDRDPTPEDTARSLRNLLAAGWEPDLLARAAQLTGEDWPPTG